MSLDAQRLGEKNEKFCPECGDLEGFKLDKKQLGILAHRFFVWGSLYKCEYGAAPAIQFNEHQETSITPSEWLKNDIGLLERLLVVGFFHYGPRLWMVGEVDPLNDLQDQSRRVNIVERIFKEYPTRILDSSQNLYRIRKAPELPNSHSEYDSPPIDLGGNGRLDDHQFPALYTSEDLDVCLHECRVTAEDDIFLATLQPVETLKMLDLTSLIKEENVIEFESLDLAVYMLFLAGSHSYAISRNISLEAKKKGL